MRSVGIKVLKNKLSEYVRLAASGETVLVTDRDRVVAEIVPPREGRSVVPADAFLAEAVRCGWVTPPRVHDAAPPPRLPVARLSDLLAAPTRDPEHFPIAVRTLDALHLASAEFLRERKQVVELAAYDDRMVKAALRIGIPLSDRAG